MTRIIITNPTAFITDKGSRVGRRVINATVADLQRLQQMATGQRPDDGKSKPED